MKNLDVLHSEALPGLDKVLAPNEEFIGILKEVAGDAALVETNEGIQTFLLKELFLRKTKFDVSRYLSFATTPEKRDEILRIIESRKSEIYNTKKLYEEIGKIAQSLFAFKDDAGHKQQILFKNKDGFCFTVDPMPLDAANTIELKTPGFIFDHAATKIDSSFADKGLSAFEPYDSLTLTLSH